MANGSTTFADGFPPDRNRSFGQRPGWDNLSREPGQRRRDGG
jgi:hypothetical protein